MARNENLDQTQRAPATKEKGDNKVAKDILLRPFRLLYLEPIVFCTCLYLAFAFGIFYLFFEAYPIIFQGVYGMSPGVSALAYLPIGIGAILACGIFFWYDKFLTRAKEHNRDWAKSEEGRRLPLACFGGPLFSVSLFWLVTLLAPILCSPTLTIYAYRVGHQVKKSTG